MTNTQVKKLINYACEQITRADLSERYPAGTKFDFDVLGDPRATNGALLVTKRILDVVSKLDFDKLVLYGPFEVVYVAKGAPADLVCQDSDGHHFYIPSGVLFLLERCRNGDFPPAFPVTETQDNNKSPQELVKEVLSRLSKGIGDLS